MAGLMRVIHKLGFLYRYHVRCGGSVALYLRTLGAQVGHGCMIDTHITNFGSEPWLIRIGDRVSLARGVCFVTHDGSSRVFRDRFAEMNSMGNKFGTIVIEENCFIGMNAILMPGIVIGGDSIVGAGSVVTRSVPPKSVVAGNPAKPICSLDAFIERYRSSMLHLAATDRVALRKELTMKLWGAER